MAEAQDWNQLPTLRKLAMILGGKGPQRPVTVTDQLARAGRRERLAEALKSQGQQIGDVPAEWSRMRMMPKYNPAAGFAQLGTTIAGKIAEGRADRDREEAQQRISQRGLEIANAPDTKTMMELAATPEGSLAIKQNPLLAAAVEQRIKPEEGYTLSPGQTRFEGDKPVASLPAESETPRAKIAAIDADKFTTESIQEFSSTGDYSKLVRREDGESLKDRLSTEEGLRKELTAASRDFRELNQRYTTIETAARNPSPAGDLAVIFGYMKMLDPTSVVREGEQAQASNAAGVPELVRGMYNRVLTGEKLTEAQRADFVNQARGLFKTRTNEQQQLVKQYADIAQRAGVDVRNVVIDAFKPAQVREPTRSAAPAEAIQFLRANPQTAPQFKEKYGYLPEGF